MEIGPGGVGLGGGFDAVREVGKEVEAGPLLNLVHAYGVVGVRSVLVIILVFKPEADGLCAGNVTCAVALHLEDGLPIVVGNCQAGGVGILASCASKVIDGLIATNCLVHRASGHVNRVCSTGDQAPYGSFQGSPYTGVEVSLTLGSLINGVVSLHIHLLVALAACIGALVPA